MLPFAKWQASDDLSGMGANVGDGLAAERPADGDTPDVKASAACAHQKTRLRTGARNHVVCRCLRPMAETPEDMTTVAHSSQASSIPWRDKPFQTINDTSAILCGSKSRTYTLLAEGTLEAVRLAGKTLVRTPSLIAFLEQETEGWKPDRKRVEKAVAGRPDVIRKRQKKAASTASSSI
jgi:hypothetical protein